MKSTLKIINTLLTILMAPMLILLINKYVFSFFPDSNVLQGLLVLVVVVLIIAQRIIRQKEKADTN